eukprot:COSAG06_NODE_2748_length_6349_cov_43.224320_6_plen_67_part_00
MIEGIRPALCPLSMPERAAPSCTERPGRDAAAIQLFTTTIDRPRATIVPAPGWARNLAQRSRTVVG